MLYAVVILSLLLSLSSAFAIPGATVPWVTYEAENGSYTGSLRGPSYTLNTVECESSGRQCVRLSSTGQYVQFTAVSNATAIVVRYSVPDTGDGVGADYTIGLYKNGTLVGRLPVTSRYSWRYGGFPFNNSPGSGSPRNFYDEVRTNGVSIVAGDVIKVQKDSADTASYYDIDLVDLENVPAAASQPGGFVSVTTYGADPSGVNDSTAAINNCIIFNSNTWIPAGTYKITGTINCVSSKTIRGAGMWYTTLVGDPSVYNSDNTKRVLLYGNGSNIKLSDFAIVGKLNYRNDNDPNDGLGGGGKFDGSSVVSNIWVEHTKTGVWVINSQGLVVSNCRFRNTIADGLNFCVGTRSCMVTNTTARGTGDDAFAIWPANYTAPAYTPGLNVIARCTAQSSNLAQGGAIYGGESNRIEDCLFQDIPYECGILFSTLFTVSQSFSGTSVAQRCDVIRCGGTRAGLEINMINNGIPGLNLNNLNINGSATTGLKIIGPNTLSNATLSDSTISTYNLSGGGGHGMWATSSASGSLTVSGSSISEYYDQPGNSFTFNFVGGTIPVTVQTSPAGRSFTVDGTNYTSTQVFNWTAGSTHTISTTSPQSGGTGTQYAWSSWSDGGAISHTVNPSVGTTYTANFTTQYYLTMNAGTGGSVSPASGWYNSGANVNISATASNGYAFSSWTGSGTGSYSGSNNPASVTMNGPITETGNFITAGPISVTVQTSPAGRAFVVDGTTYTTTQVFNWTAGSSHTVAITSSPQSGGTGTRYTWSSWSDGGAQSHTVIPTVDTTYTANFTTEYYLTMNAGTGGSVTPASGWQNGAAVVNISATPTGGYSFSSWTGSGTGSYSGSNNPASVTMNGPITETANFGVDISVTVQTVPSGRSFTVDGTAYTSPQAFNWASGSSHTIATTSPQSGGTGIQYVWSSWSDSGAISHTVAPTVGTTYTATFTTQYYLTMNAGTGGSVSPATGWNDSGANLNISATASNGYSFSSWTGSGTGSYSGSNNPASITMNGPITETGNFSVLPVHTLLFVQQPSNALQGATITPEVQVQALNASSQPIVGTTVALSLGSGTGTLSGTLNRTTDAGGIAHFNDLSVDLAGPKILTATATGNTTNSTSFMVIGPAVGLAFTTQPGSAIAGQPFGQQPVVKSVDTFGTPSAMGLPASLMVSVSRTNGAGILSGTTSLDIGTSAGNGVVTFSNLALDTAGTSNQLIASTGAASVTNPVSGMKIWLDGSATSSVLTNPSGVVTNWLDLSGFGNHFNTTIGSGGGGIRYTNTVVNGRKVVTFNATGGGSATELKNTTYNNNTKTISVFVVAKKTVAGTAEGQYQHVFATWAGGANPDYADPGSFSLDYNENNNTPRVIRACCTTYVDNNCPVMDPSAGYHVFQYIANGTGSNDIWLTSISGTTQGAGPRLDSVSANFSIAATTVGGGMLNGTTINNPFAGSIAEVLVYNSALNTADRTAVTSYLTNKWLSASGGYSLNSGLSAAFDVAPATISVTVQPNPLGRTFTVDGTPYTTAQVFNWVPGSIHTIATTSPQTGGTGIQHVWSSWSDAGTISHTVAPTTGTTYTAYFTTQYYLAMNTSPGGSVSPSADWYDSGANLNISATASNGYTFHTWTGTGSGSYSGTNNPASVTINGPITQTAGFAAPPDIMQFTVSGAGTVSISYATVSGLTYHVETTTNLLPATWTTVPGSTTNADGSVIIFIDPTAPGELQRFYRIGSP